MQVPSWETIDPKDPQAINELSTAYMESDGNMRNILSTLFNSDFFKNSMNLPKVKSPTELIVGVIKQTGEFNSPTPGIHEFAVTTLNGSAVEGPLAIMGQRLMNPPTVEGWHTGSEWIDSGTLSERIGFVEKQFADPLKPGVSEMVSRIGSLDDNPSELVDRCLDLLGAVHNLIQMTASTVDYQFA